MTVHTTGGATVDLHWSKTTGYLLGLTVDANGHTEDATLGIGADPVTAEEVLSSIRTTD